MNDTIYSSLLKDDVFFYPETDNKEYYVILLMGVLYTLRFYI